MLISKTNFLEWLPVQPRLILSRKLNFYSVFYADSDSEILFWIPTPPPISKFRFRLRQSRFSDSDARVYLRKCAKYQEYLFRIFILIYFCRKMSNNVHRWSL